MTSAVMMLRYHGILWLPDGQDLNPETLNTWLKTQTDGYVSGGLLNWMALTRLTKIISQQRGTTKLEYSRSSHDLYYKAGVAFGQRQPVIFEVPGHFVVGTGLTANQNDVWINDPFYSYDKLSQHASGPISARFLKPSHTDLSYILVTADAPVTLFLATADNTFVEGVETFSEALGGTDSNETSPVMTFLQLPKPETQTYHLFMMPADNLPYHLTIYHYDLEGEVVIQEFNGIADEAGTIIPIEYHKDPDASLATWTQLQTVLDQFYQQAVFSRYITYYKLKRIVSYALLATPSNQLRYTYLLSELLTTFQNTLPQEQFETLQNLILELQTALIATLDSS